ncbi:prtT Transcriptional activator of proteases prtT [Candida maltosa Xu316]
MNQQFAMNNQIQFMQQQQLHQQQRYGTTQIDYTLNNTRVQSPETTRQSLANSPELLEPKRLADDNYTESTRKKRKLKDAHSKEDQFSHDFRDGFLSKKEAFELFDFFNANISQQLFGFEISKFNIEDLWETCPILVCAISTIASIHHPKLSVKSGPLQGYLRNLCGSIILNRPKNEKEGFNTIVALVLCSFWLTDSQMFTGLALQLAKEYGLNRPSRKNKDKLKLWYLLYVLDGQQSLTFNRQPLLNSEEYSLKHSKELLLQGQENIVFKDRETKLLHQTEESTASLPTDEEIAKLIAKQRLTDMRLVSQVEYNQALNEAFKGNAWDLLSPSAFGMPSKSNLELDKWMVSWTVLLAPGNFGAVWSTKSTLIYYNFAKMHINSTAVRKLTIDPNNNSFPKWDSSLTISTVTNSNGTNNTVKQIKDSDEDWEDSSDDEYGDDDFLSNKELVSSDEAVISANIALNAAHTVLNLVINDKDILDNLKYVPVHIHIMLYYAALLLMNPPAKSNNQTIEINEIQYHENLLNNLKVVYLLQRKIYTNLPIDSKFGNRLIKNLHDVTLEKLREVQKFVDGLPDDKEEKLTLSKTINSLLESNDNKFEEIFDYELSSDGSSRSGTPLPEKISAWPGSNHGHP